MIHCLLHKNVMIGTRYEIYSLISIQSRVRIRNFLGLTLTILSSMADCCSSLRKRVSCPILPFPALVAKPNCPISWTPTTLGNPSRDHCLKTQRFIAPFCFHFVKFCCEANWSRYPSCQTQPSFKISTSRTLESMILVIVLIFHLI